MPVSVYTCATFCLAVIVFAWADIEYQNGSACDYDEKTMAKFFKMELEMEQHRTRLETMEKKIGTRQEELEQGRIGAMEQLSKMEMSVRYLKEQLEDDSIRITEELSRYRDKLVKEFVEASKRMSGEQNEHLAKSKDDLVDEIVEITSGLLDENKRQLITKFEDVRTLYGSNFTNLTREVRKQVDKTITNIKGMYM